MGQVGRIGIDRVAVSGGDRIEVGGSVRCHVVGSLEVHGTRRLKDGWIQRKRHNQAIVRKVVTLYSYFQDGPRCDKHKDPR